MTRVWHPWDRWECVAAGMYESVAPAQMDSEAALNAYATFLRDTPRFTRALMRVLAEWPIACEHFLSHSDMNRIAWLGQASMCIETGVPACFRGGFHRLNDVEKRLANETAAAALQCWLRAHDAALPLTLGAIDDAAPASSSDVIPLTGSMRNRVRQYVRAWTARGYEDGIPNEVPAQLTALHLAPSYRAVACAILKNDYGLLSLGGVPRESAWYGALKRMEIAARPKPVSPQLELFA